jgi:hypothetical protein
MSSLWSEYRCKVFPKGEKGSGVNESSVNSGGVGYPANARSWQVLHRFLTRQYPICCRCVHITVVSSVFFVSSARAHCAKNAIFCNKKLPNTEQRQYWASYKQSKKLLQ